MSAAQVIQKSSNVGAAKIALSLPREEMHDMFQRIGFGDAPHLGFPGAAAGRLREAKTWRPIEQATMAYGHGISVSLIQLARAYTVFAARWRTGAALRCSRPACRPRASACSRRRSRAKCARC